MVNNVVKSKYKLRTQKREECRNMVCVGNLSKCRAEFNELLIRIFPQELSDPELVEKALAYERVLTSQARSLR